MLLPETRNQILYWNFIWPISDYLHQEIGFILYHLRSESFWTFLWSLRFVTPFFNIIRSSFLLILKDLGWSKEPFRFKIPNSPFLSLDHTWWDLFSDEFNNRTIIKVRDIQDQKYISYFFIGLILPDGKSVVSGPFCSSFSICIIWVSFLGEKREKWNWKNSWFLCFLIWWFYFISVN